jgi:hypothetical protein
VTPAIIINDGHDLVLTMTRSTSVTWCDRPNGMEALISPRCAFRPRRVSDHGCQQHRTPDQAPTAPWLEAGAGRPIDLLHGPALDDIDDPYGQSRRIRQAAQASTPLWSSCCHRTMVA